MNQQSLQMTEQHQRAARTINDFLTTLGSGNVAATATLVAENAVFEYPYATEGAPERIEDREEIVRRALEGGLKTRRNLRFLDAQISPMLDPEWVVIEFRNESVTADTNQPYNQHFLNLIRVIDGQIIYFKEFYNPIIELAAGNPRAKT